jgi:hypothetical protein
LPSIATTLLSEKNFYFDKTVPIEAVTPETSVLFSIIPLVVFFCFPIIIRKEVDGKLEQKVEYEGIWRAEDIKLQISDKDDDYELSEGIDDAVESEANVSQSKGFDLVDYLYYATFGRSDQVEENLSSGFSDFLNDDKDEEEENQESPPLADVDNILDHIRTCMVATLISITVIVMQITTIKTQIMTLIITANVFRTSNMSNKSSESMIGMVMEPAPFPMIFKGRFSIHF